MSIYDNYPDSSVIKYICWDEESELMAVVFNTNSMWLYFAVPQEVYQKLISADSVGAFFNKNVRNSYRATKYVPHDKLKAVLQDGQEKQEKEAEA